MMHDVTEGRDVEFAPPNEDTMHSLPTPEEMRTEASIRSNQAGSEAREAKLYRRSRQIGICMATLCAIGLIISLSLFFVDRGSTSRDEENAYREKWAKSYLSALPFGEAIANEDEDSPQWRAMNWLVRDDPLRMALPRSADDARGKKFVERFILTLLYFSAGGENWSNNMRFLTGKDTCEWNRFFQDGEGEVFLLGAQCINSDSVNKIWIPNNGLIGTIPFDELMHLTSLRTIAFEYNGEAEGTLPDNISDLSELEILSLSNNLITGLIPESMATMTSLQRIMLDDNEFTGQITPLINLPNLELVYLEDNFFEGKIDDSYFPSALNLKHLDLSDNVFSGTVPPHFFGESNLEVLDLHGNLYIGGNLPQFSVEQSNLKFLALHINKMTGDIPPSIGNLRGLRHLDLSDNELTGELTEAMGDLRQLEYLFLGRNPFDEAPIPNFIRDLTNLVDLSLKRSNRVNVIPDWIGTDLKNLRLLDLDGNKLNGQIPETLASLKKIVFLLLNRNDITGEVPKSFVNLPLEVLVLDNTEISGDLNFLCEAREQNPLDYMVADCNINNPEVNCTEGTCCRVCCLDGDGCNDINWLANHDPIWENNYQRSSYSFDDELKWVPTSNGSSGEGN
mmetsp:Transcript_8982/g.13233  ORF Transcript_8982/g.13233 Transcript_8982/m.13233 type:complete len:621 (-) Transcript_8982:480-2342(-)